MSDERRSLLPHWWIDGQPEGFGYFQNQAMLPMPGDHVFMHPDEGDQYEVIVHHRTFEQPERDHPVVTIHATRVVGVRREDTVDDRLRAMALDDARTSDRRAQESWREAATLRTEVERLRSELATAWDDGWAFGSRGHVGREQEREQNPYRTTADSGDSP
jgi:hypothetical protein